jgi:hypothetical protein
MKLITILLTFLLVVSAFAGSQTLSDEQLKQRLEQLEKELAAIKAQMANAPAQAPSQAPAQAPAPATGGGAQPAEAPANVPKETTAEEDAPQTSVKVYGFAMLDTGYQAGANDPAWFDVIRTTKLPAFADQFGKGGNWYAGVRQSRLGVKTNTPTRFGELKTIFEFELFGVGVDAGQTTFRLRHAWGELGQVGAGQTWSPFMDPDVFPNSLEYWGPAGMVFFRNVQLRWTPINKKGHNFMMAIERPGASADTGSLAGRVEIANTRARFPAPDFSTRYRYSGERGHLQLATMLRYLKWDDLLPGDGIDTSGDAIGWGVNLSANWIFNNRKDTLRLQGVYGKGIQNYMNDSPVDIAPVLTANPISPLDGHPLAQVGVVAFLDHNWSDRWSSTLGYSLNDVENTALQAPSAFSRGHYGLFNLAFYPVKNVMMASEFQWGRRENYRDGWTYDDYRVQLGFKYNFSYDILGGAK